MYFIYSSDRCLINQVDESKSGGAKEQGSLLLAPTLR